MSFRDYTKIKQLGAGGNGLVYQMKDYSNSEYAVKVAKKLKDQRLKRFETEAIKVKELYDRGQRGIIPVIHYELPCKESLRGRLTK